MKICPTIELPEKPEVDLNSSKWFRIAVVGDVDGNDGITALIKTGKMKYRLFKMIKLNDCIPRKLR